MGLLSESPHVIRNISIHVCAQTVARGFWAHMGHRPSQGMPEPSFFNSRSLGPHGMPSTRPGEAQALLVEFSSTRTGTTDTMMRTKKSHVCSASSLRNCCLHCRHCHSRLPRPMPPLLVPMCAAAAAAGLAADANAADDNVAATAVALATNNTNNGPLLLLMLLLCCCCCSRCRCHCRYCCHCCCRLQLLRHVGVVSGVGLACHV